MPYGVTGLPIDNHVGAFGVERRHHIHEGVDLYVPTGTPVRSVEPGVVVAVLPLTGITAQSPWWLDTECVMVEGTSGVVLYGEIEVGSHIKSGRYIGGGDHIGYVTRVLRNDKGRPLSMLHLERHLSGTRTFQAWDKGAPRPASLLDPTPFLLPLVESHTTC